VFLFHPIQPVIHSFYTIAANSKENGAQSQAILEGNITFMDI
jgi:hypothetical protein